MPFRIGSILLLACIALALSACGGGGDTTTVTETAAESVSSEPDSGAALVDYSTCPEAAEGRELSEEMVETGEEGIEEGKEVAAAESLVREAEKSLRESDERCRVEADLKQQEAKICRNTPQALAEALEVEDTPANREYIGVYEATCGKRVPIR